MKRKVRKKTENQSPQGEQTKQLKLNSFSSQLQKKLQEQEKQIIITRFDRKLVWNELILEIEFKLSPNKDAFSKIKTELWFDQEKTKSFLFDILHSFGPTDEFKLKATLDLEGLPSGNHSVKIEMYEFWSFLEKSSHTEKEITFYYSPQKKKPDLERFRY